MLQHKLKHTLSAIALALGAFACSNLFAASDTEISQELSISKSIIAQNPGLNHEMVMLGVAGMEWAERKTNVGNKQYLTLIDFTKPSNEKRLSVIDMHTYKTVMQINVAHGKNSGVLYAKQFSNRGGSDETSLGVYVTQDTFMGEHGLSLHIKGMEAGINSNASKRAVEIHCAKYVSDSFIAKHGRAGRSWGCFAVSPAVCHKLAKMLAGGSVIFAYALPEAKDPNLKN